MSDQMRRLGAALAVVGLLLLAVNVTASGRLVPLPGSSEVAAEQRLRRAATKTFRRPVVTYRLDLAASGVDVMVIATADVSSGRMTGTLRVPDSEAGDRVLELRAQGHRLFLRARAGAWQETDLVDVLGASGEAEVLEALALARPQELLGLLRASTSSARATTEAVDGIDTTRYLAEVEVPLSNVRDPIADRALVDLIAAHFAPDGVDVDAWIDANGKVRRLELNPGNHAPGPVLELAILSFGDRLDTDVPADAVSLPITEVTHLLRRTTSEHR
jgi:hypothetical protein